MLTATTVICLTLMVALYILGPIAQLLESPAGTNKAKLTEAHESR